MVKKAIVALACVFIVSLRLRRLLQNAQGITGQRCAEYCRGSNSDSTHHFKPRAASAAGYQPAGTLVIRTDGANPERFDMFGPGLVYDKDGRPVTSSIKPGTRVRVFYAD